MIAVRPTSSRDTFALKAAGALIVAVIAWFNFVVGLGQPAGAIWDESYYVTSTARYEHGVAQFASHPPLGLMLIAAGSRLHPSPPVDTEALVGVKKASGEQIPSDYDWSGLRIASGVAAVVATLLYYGLMLQLGQGAVSAIVFTMLFAFQTAFLSHFRAGHLDAFQIAFLLAGVSALIHCLQSDRQRLWSKLLAGMAFGAALMVKINVLPLLIMPAAVGGVRAWRRRRDGVWPMVRRLASDGAVMTLGVLAAVALTFAIHLEVGRRTPDPITEAGRKDLGAAAGPYGEYIVGQRAMSPAVFLSAIVDYRRFMDADFTGTTLTDPNGSSPVSWPFLPKSINYRWDSSGDRTAYVQLLANPIAWLAGSVALIASTGAALISTSTPASRSRKTAALILLVGWSAFMAVHLLIATQRVVYTYHYFPALVLTLLMAPLAWDAVKARLALSAAVQGRIGGLLTAAILAGFVVTAPFALHWPVTRTVCETLTPLGGVPCR